MKLRALLVTLLASALAQATLSAQTIADDTRNFPRVILQEESVSGPDAYVFDKPLGIVYQNKESALLNQLSLTGELELQWAGGESNQGSYGSRDLAATNKWGDIDQRRWRLGVASQWFHNQIEFHGVIDVNPNWNPFYKDIYELAITYQPSEAFNLGIGKQKARFFTQEYNTRVRELIVFEQSLLVNTLVPTQLTGVWVNGSLGNWKYALAGYAGDAQTEFARFNAGTIIQASIGYDFKTQLGVDTALVRLDYQHSSDSANTGPPGKFSDAFSLNSTVQKGRFYFYSDILGGVGRGTQGDVWGVVLTPTYFIIPQKLQFVTRYQYAHGDHDGLNLQSRYEALASGELSTKGAGSDYNALYFGLNYYIYGHNLKLMAGTEYNDMTGGKKDFSGWTTLVGLRLAF